MEDILEVSVGDIADSDTVLHGIVDRAGLLFNSCLGEGRASPVDSRSLQGRISHHLHPSSIRSRPLVGTPLNQITKWVTPIFTGYMD